MPILTQNTDKKYIKFLDYQTPDTLTVGKFFVWYLITPSTLTVG